jgi:hypothetical protein
MFRRLVGGGALIREGYLDSRNSFTSYLRVLSIYLNTTNWQQQLIIGLSTDRYAYRDR